MNRFGVRLPLKPFFAVTSAFLYYMAFVFAGGGIAELQEGGFVPMTPVSWAPRIPALGLHPTVETLAAQGVLLALALLALVWTFVIEPRRTLAAERRRSTRQSRDAHAGSLRPFGDRIAVAEPLFRDFGGVTAFAGEIETVRVFEDNALVRRILESAAGAESWWWTAAARAAARCWAAGSPSSLDQRLERRRGKWMRARCRRDRGAPWA